MYDVVILGAPGAESTVSVLLARDATGSGDAAGDTHRCYPLAASKIEHQYLARPSTIARTANSPERRLAAIFAADAADYSRLMGEDEVDTLRTLMAHRTIMELLIVQHRGRVANTAGDSVLAEFASAVDAVQCGAAVQEQLAEANLHLLEDRRLRFRIGVHVGDVMIENGDIFGDGVNIAARLQGLAEPGGICLSAEAHVHIRKVVKIAFADLGPHQVKNVDEPVRVYSYPACLAVATSRNLLSGSAQPNHAALERSHSTLTLW